MRGDTLPWPHLTNSSVPFWRGADPRFLLVKSRNDNGERQDGGRLAIGYQISVIRDQEARGGSIRVKEFKSKGV
jgi:hypothetical protein